MVKSIAPQEANELFKSGQAVLIDVREPDEYAAEHIMYAISFPLTQLQMHFSDLSFPIDRKIVFQCLKGSRGEKACMIVKSDSDVQNEIFNIEGGIDAWKQAGLPVYTQSSHGYSIFRQVQMVVGSLIFVFTILGLLGIWFFFMLVGAIGIALFIAGYTGWCGLALLLRQMPWNKSPVLKKSCC